MNAPSDFIPVPERARYRARWVFPAGRPPIENGVVEIERGHITAVHARSAADVHDFDNAAIIPGLVNAHTHLEFSDLPRPLEPAAPFSAWIDALLEFRGARTAPLNQTVARGRDETARAGTTQLAEITTDDGSVAGFEPFGPKVYALRESIAFLPEQIAPQWELARAHLARQTETNAENIEFGLCPHASFSVHPQLYGKLVTLAQETGVLFAFHLAETRAELELLERHTGELADRIRQFDLWRDEFVPRGSRPLDYLRPLENLQRALIIHGNYLADDEIDFLAGRENITVVFCPRTHAFFGHRDHPWQKMLTRGCTVVIGTDSRASNPDLSLFNELKFLAAHFPDFDRATLLEMGTGRSARALDPTSDRSRLAAGSAADLAVVSLARGTASSPYELLFDPQSAIAGTMLHGRWLSGHGSGTGVD